MWIHAISTHMWRDSCILWRDSCERIRVNTYNILTSSVTCEHCMYSHVTCEYIACMYCVTCEYMQCIHMWHVNIRVGSHVNIACSVTCEYMQCPLICDVTRLYVTWLMWKNPCEYIQYPTIGDVTHLYVTRHIHMWRDSFLYHFYKVI